MTCGTSIFRFSPKWGIAVYMKMSLASFILSHRPRGGGDFHTSLCRFQDMTVSTESFNGILTVIFKLIC
ncbi:MAG: hypothetical protein COX16_15030 [Deltaproteobacteria bacterium CG23_combo_of_CG06-09_8_20_14_all_51_20]|nr:MAG: hypothetical protein AUK25_02100 [Desulfobacteraceae bacterium CG2_30_51_40]PIP45079.1 MAG: hypothetical protein COX16_15030 [Deltaproteobacteria bacterium CG23_combo_of_CG06-09_8_20_14_all_51_20]PIV99680.1 MAG: hypothetical protein COW41_07340 [Deltaproteobacteria bacterium CG17_big_fil_post_rev_8_21_14_2_50_51_6]PJB37041.1 MAG: hypothetical protein CO107_06050 [Deltaproteobacteria bacterium CG_4_9_14_3_um_filter_51_14]